MIVRAMALMLGSFVTLVGCGGKGAAPSGEGSGPGSAKTSPGMPPMAKPAGMDAAAAKAQPRSKPRPKPRFALPIDWSCGAKPPSVATTDADRKKAFWASPEEKLRPTRWDGGDTTISNEARLELFRPAVAPNGQGIGGGYVGVGSTQNYVLAAWAKAEWIWLMDFTRVVVWANKAHVAFIAASQTPAAYLALWQKKKRKEAAAVIAKHYAKDPELPKIQRAYLKARPFVFRRFEWLQRWMRRYRFQSWIKDPAQYGHIRKLALAGRIRPIRGDLNGATTLCGIGVAARAMGIAIRVLYPSNAEEYKAFRPYRAAFKRNVAGLPGDDKSVVLRTYTFSPKVHPWAKGWKGHSRVGFHFNAQPLANFKAWLAGKPTNVKLIMRQAKLTVRRPAFSWVRTGP